MINIEPSSSFASVEKYEKFSGKDPEIDYAANALEDDEEEEEIPIEPRFKYERVLNDVVKVKGPPKTKDAERLFSC